METKIRTDLLRELAQHLLKGKLGHEKFDFSVFNDHAVPGHCGTNGCAAGECPIIWPDKWCFSTNAHESFVNLISTVESGGKLTTQGVWKDLAEFFRINLDMVYHLFSPSTKYQSEWEDISQSTVIYGGQLLDDYATKEEVAQNILLFCDRADAGQFTT